MNCEAVREMLWAYLEKETTAEEAVKIEEHLKHCADCREELELQKEMMETLAGLPDEELPEGYHAELMQKLQAEATPKVVPFPVKKKKRSVWKQWGMVAAAVLVVVAAGGMNGMLEMRESQNAAVQEMKAMDTAESVDISVEDVAEEGNNAELKKKDLVAYKMTDASAAGTETEEATTQSREKQADAEYDAAAVPEIASAKVAGEVVPFSVTRSVKMEATDQGTLVVADISAAMAELQKAIAEAGGFEEEAEEGSVVASIPSENYDSFVRTMEMIGTLNWTKKGEPNECALLRTIEIQLERN